MCPIARRPLHLRRSLGDNISEMATNTAKCPLRPGQPCTLCHPDAHLGPQDCPIVALVMDDPFLRAGVNDTRKAHRAAALAESP